MNGILKLVYLSTPICLGLMRSITWRKFKCMTCCTNNLWQEDQEHIENYFSPLRCFPLSERAYIADSHLGASGCKSCDSPSPVPLHRNVPLPLCEAEFTSGYGDGAQFLESQHWNPFLCDKSAAKAWQTNLSPVFLFYLVSKTSRNGVLMCYSHD